MLYLILSNIALIVFFLIYWLGLRKLTFFQWNRWFLLGSLFAAYLIPMGLYVQVPMPEMMIVELPEITIGANQQAIEANQVSADKWDILSFQTLNAMYWLGVAMFSAWFLYRIVELLRTIGAGSAKGSFSFFGKIVLSKELQDEDLQQVRNHELEHVKQGHSLDIILLEIFRLFNWFNPIYPMLIREMKFVHECIVDEKNADNKVAYAELLLAQAMNTQSALLQHEFSNNSLLKNRITMLFKEKTAYKFKAIYLLTLPATLFMLFLVVNCKQEEQKTEPPVEEITLLDLPEEEKFEGSLIDNPEILADYPGGIDNFRKFVQEKYTYTQAAIDAGVKGKIVANFIIGSDGAISNIIITEDLGHGTGEALIAAIEKAEKWKPAIQDGKPVASRFMIPLRLDLTQQ
ncbi:M56 family metallopeptidase [Sphingobacterium hotanense]|uniref:M56 family metallopeptidase n=1 Tax=Sphingobacterium hotanense TaxID=649196 RepID=UPI0021A5053E|nr:energy transducer TonB [Sphingobacterium hotanense]MCT1524580.1 energy transducer TonB [Sphingobacterium hotanense]